MIRINIVAYNYLFVQIGILLILIYTSPTVLRTECRDARLQRCQVSTDWCFCSSCLSPARTVLAHSMSQENKFALTCLPVSPDLCPSVSQNIIYIYPSQISHFGVLLKCLFFFPFWSNKEVFHLVTRYLLLVRLFHPHLCISLKNDLFLDSCRISDIYEVKIRLQKGYTKG